MVLTMMINSFYQNYIVFVEKLLSWKLAIDTLWMFISIVKSSKHICDMVFPKNFV